MSDRMDLITALKNVDRVMPEEATIIREYISLFKSRIPAENKTIYESTDKVQEDAK